MKLFVIQLNIIIGKTKETYYIDILIRHTIYHNKIYD